MNRSGIFMAVVFNLLLSVASIAEAKRGAVISIPTPDGHCRYYYDLPPNTQAVIEKIVERGEKTYLEFSCPVGFKLIEELPQGSDLIRKHLRWYLDWNAAVVSIEGRVERLSPSGEWETLEVISINYEAPGAERMHGPTVLLRAANGTNFSCQREDEVHVRCDEIPSEFNAIMPENADIRALFLDRLPGTVFVKGQGEISKTRLASSAPAKRPLQIPTDKLEKMLRLRIP